MFGDSTRAERIGDFAQILHPEEVISDYSHAVASKQPVVVSSVICIYWTGGGGDTNPPGTDALCAFSGLPAEQPEDPARDDRHDSR